MPDEAMSDPRRREHTFRVVGDQPSRHLLVLTPGGFESFFADMAQGGFRIPEDMEGLSPMQRGIACVSQARRSELPPCRPFQAQSHVVGTICSPRQGRGSGAQHCAEENAIRPNSLGWWSRAGSNR